MSLTPIPWQPVMSVHPDMLVKLERASQLRGHDITLSGSRAPNGVYLAAWRSYDTLVYLWNGWVKRLPGFNSASNPSNGPRSHSRGVGADLYPYDVATLNACKAAGIQVNAIVGEPWHVQLPNFTSYPIIDTNVAVAGGGTPITPTNPIEEDKMTAQDIASINAHTDAALAALPSARGATIMHVTLPGAGAWYFYVTPTEIVQFVEPDANFVDLLAYAADLWPTNGGFTASAKCKTFTPDGPGLIRLLKTLCPAFPGESYGLSPANPFHA